MKIAWIIAYVVAYLIPWALLLYVFRSHAKERGQRKFEYDVLMRQYGEAINAMRRNGENAQFYKNSARAQGDELVIADATLARQRILIDKHMQLMGDMNHMMRYMRPFVATDMRPEIDRLISLSMPRELHGNV